MENLSNWIRRILWEEWDPIGVNDLGGPDDEYDAYAARLVQYVNEGRDEHAIAKYLGQVETNAMGLSKSNAGNNMRVAKLLVSLPNST